MRERESGKNKRDKRKIEGWRMEIKGTIKQKNKQEFVLLFSPCTITSCATTASPYSLVATHSYMPASPGATGEISRAPKEVMENLSGGRGVPSVLRQVIVAVGKL